MATIEIFVLDLSPHIVQQVAALLGRQPRGLEAIAIAAPDGQPMVIRVASLVHGKPFPTLFWLVDPALCYRIDQAEAGGLIKRLQARIDVDPALQSAMQKDHQTYIRLRQQHMTAAIRASLQAGGYHAVLASKGVGGIGDFTRIRCLHTWYGAHLVVPNTVGAMLEQWWREQAE